MDEALNALLLKSGDPYEVFKENLTYDQLKDADFHQYDLDMLIFTPEQLKTIHGKSIAYQTWACLRVKGRLLLDAYIKNIYPKITKVYEVQKEIEGRPGILDAVVELAGYGKVLLDHKTSARPYKKEAVHSSTQLALYAEAEGIERIGFAILVKNIEKNQIKTCTKCNGRIYSQHKTCSKIVEGERCHGKLNIETDPEGVIQLMIEDVEPMTKEIVKESMSQVENAIHNKIFPMNLSACGKMYGKPCPYIDFCWKKNENGLEYKKGDKR